MKKQKHYKPRYTKAERQAEEEIDAYLHGVHKSSVLETLEELRALSNQ